MDLLLPERIAVAELAQQHRLAHHHRGGGVGADREHPVQPLPQRAGVAVADRAADQGLACPGRTGGSCGGPNERTHPPSPACFAARRAASAGPARCRPGPGTARSPPPACRRCRRSACSRRGARRIRGSRDPSGRARRCRSDSPPTRRIETTFEVNAGSTPGRSILRCPSRRRSTAAVGSSAPGGCLPSRITPSWASRAPSTRRMPRLGVTVQRVRICHGGKQYGCGQACGQADPEAVHRGTSARFTELPRLAVNPSSIPIR